MNRLVITLLLTTFLITKVAAQDNYEIQVYGSELVTPKHTMLELHSNYTADGSTVSSNGVKPTNHVVHETIEVTHGINEWWEIGFYLFSSWGNNGRTNVVGSHVRPRFAVPKSKNWPVGFSVSAEVGYQRREFSEDDITLELRPIIDKQINKLYLSFNPVFDQSFHGYNTKQIMVFSPNVKVSYQITKELTPGIEYYGGIGPFNELIPISQQQHAIFITNDFDFSENWELNVGFGWGLTKATDNGIFKVILGRRF